MNQVKYLEPNHEIIGILTGLENTDDQIVMEFTIHKKIGIPIGAIPREKLQKMVGTRIGVFNNDGDYRTRRVKKITKGKE